MTKIKKILIANRGEIAVRVMKTCRKMGIGSVAVYSDADCKALHVRMADEAVHIGASPATESYLVIDKIIAACKSSGADAVHPGYGFLSENPEFARRLKQEKITFIGPSPESMEAMGLKDAAKKLMEKAGVPVTPGYHGKDQNAKLLKAKAGMIGYPVLIKAIAGGGGKGMRKVDAAGDFDDALASCMREAKSAFGDDRVLIEKYILSPRHIEVQVFGDTHGNVVHMYERDCSLQRRHQKVIEEAPAPGMTDTVRKAMTDAAIDAAKAVNYVGAGTVEFIVDGSGKLRSDGFWFMEMNTRLQVEHPVTEMITGLDLVEWQIRVAQGEKLPKQKDIKLEGHAVEARLYAEDPANDFLPSIGIIKQCNFSEDYDEESGARCDTGVEYKDKISIHYDPMIAKIIGYGEDREDAILHCSNKLIHTEIFGVTTNTEFLVRTLAHKDFQEEKINTAFIPMYLQDLIGEDLSQTDEAFALAACNLCARKSENITPITEMGSWRLNLKDNEKWNFQKNGEILTVEILRDSDEGWYVSVNEKQPFFIENRAAQSDVNELNSLKYYAEWARWCDDELVSLKRNGKSIILNRYQAKGTLNATTGGNAITAPMPGKVVAVNVKPGDSVTAGDKLIIMEAMKMEISLEAPRNGVVATVHAAADALVSDGETLLELEEEDSK